MALKVKEVGNDTHTVRCVAAVLPLPPELQQWTARVACVECLLTTHCGRVMMMLLHRKRWCLISKGRCTWTETAGRMWATSSTKASSLCRQGHADKALKASHHPAIIATLRAEDHRWALIKALHSLKYLARITIVLLLSTASSTMLRAVAQSRTCEATKGRVEGGGASQERQSHVWPSFVTCTCAAAYPLVLLPIIKVGELGGLVEANSLALSLDSAAHTATTTLQLASAQVNYRWIPYLPQNELFQDIVWNQGWVGHAAWVCVLAQKVNHLSTSCTHTHTQRQLCVAADRSTVPRDFVLGGGTAPASMATCCADTPLERAF